MSAGDLKISEVKGDGGRVVVACGWAWSLDGGVETGRVLHKQCGASFIKRGVVQPHNYT